MPGIVYVNPAVMEDKRDAMAVALNEALRIFIEDVKFKPEFEVTPEQRKLFRGTAYDNDEDALKKTVVARVATFDSSVAPTPEQVRETRRLLDIVTGALGPNHPDAGLVRKIDELLASGARNEKAEAAPSASAGTARDAALGGYVRDWAQRKYKNTGGRLELASPGPLVSGGWSAVTNDPEVAISVVGVNATPKETRAFDKAGPQAVTIPFTRPKIIVDRDTPSSSVMHEYTHVVNAGAHIKRGFFERLTPGYNEVRSMIAGDAWARHTKYAGKTPYEIVEHVMPSAAPSEKHAMYMWIKSVEKAGPDFSKVDPSDVAGGFSAIRMWQKELDDGGSPASGELRQLQNLFSHGKNLTEIKSKAPAGSGRGRTATDRFLEGVNKQEKQEEARRMVNRADARGTTRDAALGGEVAMTPSVAGLTLSDTPVVPVAERVLPKKSWVAAARDILIERESFRSTAYPDPDLASGKWAVAYGNRYHIGQKVSVKKGDTVSRDKAEAYLADAMQHNIRKLSASMGPGLWDGLTGGQKAALTSWAYNIGETKARGSTLVRRLKRGEDARRVIREELPRWSDKGRAAERRAAELALAESADYE